MYTYVHTGIHNVHILKCVHMTYTYVYYSLASCAVCYGRIYSAELSSGDKSDKTVGIHVPTYNYYNYIQFHN